MSRGNKWVALDKNLSQEFKCIKREFSMIEAMYSYSLDQDNGSTGTISGYSKLWGWSRNKVRRFIEGIRTDEGHFKDSKRTLQGHPIHFIDNALMNKKDTSRTLKGHLKDTCHDTTIEPDPNPDPKPNKIYPPNLKKFVENYYSYIEKTTPTKMPTGKNVIGASLDCLDKLSRIDGFKEEYILEIIRWAKKDSFWQDQVFSLAGLRNKNKAGLMKFQNIIISYDKKSKTEPQQKTKEQLLAEYS